MSSPDYEPGAGDANDGDDDVDEEDGRISESEMVELLMDALDIYSEENDTPMRLQPYEEVGMLTLNKGLVARVRNTEFQITVMYSGYHPPRRRKRGYEPE